MVILLLKGKKRLLLAPIVLLFFLLILFINDENHPFHNVFSNQDEPQISGPVTTVPWENDERFLKAKTEYGTPVMMAAYCTFLPDPLPGEEYNVHLAAQFMAGTVIGSGQVFSQNRTVGPYIKKKGYREGPTYNGTRIITTIGGGVCKVATTLYNVTVLCNLEIVERHAHAMPVSYAPYGQDATVSYGYFDFKFKNTTPDNILIWSQGIGNNLYIAFYGKSSPPKVEWHHRILNRNKTYTVYKTNPDLPKGAQRYIVQGIDGATVKSWVTIQNSDGTTKTKYLGVSCYKPLMNIIEKGS